MPNFFKRESTTTKKYLNARECLILLTEEEKNLLIENKTDIEFKASETIVKRGMPTSNALYLTEGLVKLEIISNNKPFTISLIEPHSFIGIVCCFAFDRFDFDVMALEDSKVSFINMEVFEGFIKNNSEFSLNLLKHVSGVVHDLLHKMSNLSQKNIDGALSLLLLDFQRIYGTNNFRLPMMRLEMAKTLGYSKESVINTLSKFNKEGILNVSDRNIEILDLPLLQRISKTG